MKNADCVGLLQWALPRLGLRWAGYRKLRRRVCKRIARRLRELGLADVAAYRARRRAPRPRARRGCAASEAVIVRARMKRISGRAAAARPAQGLAAGS